MVKKRRAIKPAHTHVGSLYKASLFRRRSGSWDGSVRDKVADIGRRCNTFGSVFKQLFSREKRTLPTLSARIKLRRVDKCVGEIWNNLHAVCENLTHRADGNMSFGDNNVYQLPGRLYLDTELFIPRKEDEYEMIDSIFQLIRDSLIAIDDLRRLSVDDTDLLVASDNVRIIQLAITGI